MIPLSLKDRIDFTDLDGTKWGFLPKTGEREKRLIGIYDDSKEKPNKEWIEIIDPFIDDIVLSVNDRVVSPTSPKKFSEIFTQSEKIEIIKIWHEANTLKPEEKKS